MPEEYENAIEWLDGQKTATVTVHSQKQKTALLRLAKAHPDKVKIVADPEENGGFLLAHLPVGWIRFQAPPPRGVMSEEEREKRRQRMKALRAEQLAGLR